MQAKAAGLTIFILICAASLFAQDVNPRLVFSNGASFISAQRVFTVDGDSFRSEYANGGKSTLRGEIDLNSHLSIEAGYGYGTNNLRMFELNSLGVPRVQRDYGVRVHQFGANALAFLNPRDARFRVFGTAGLALEHFSPTDKAKAYAASVQFIQEKASLSSSSALGFNFGGGVEARTTEKFGLRFDFRDHITDIPTYGVPVTNPGNGADFYPVNGKVQNMEVSVGILFYLTPQIPKHK